MLFIVIISLLRVLSCVQCDKPKITVTGYKGGTAIITCPSGGYRNYRKYLWKGTYYNGVYVIKSNGQSEWTHTGRLSLQDEKDRNIFTVTIIDLTIDDAGQYGCGIEKPGWDYYTVVILKVEATTGYTRSANSMSGHVGYIGVGLTGLVLVLVISLAILHKKKTRGRRAISAPPGPQPNTNSDHNTEQNPESVDYSPVSFDQDDESLRYASVSFTDPPASGNKQGSTQQHEGDGAVIYSTVNKSKKT